MDHLPVIDIGPLVTGNGDVEGVARQIRDSCRQYGFFYINGHGIDPDMEARLEMLSRSFFSQPAGSKMNIHMSKGGKAWRGYFPVGEELTSGKPDLKEGLYFGEQLNTDHPKVLAGVPLHGKNLFPEEIDGFRELILDYMDAMTVLGHTLMRGLSLSLGLDEAHFNDFYTSDPFILFRVFHYPAMHQTSAPGSWGVGEHTDYGVLTILKQDDHGGLQVRSAGRWIEAPPIPGTFVCNIGDMLDRMTGGYYRSTPHRVHNTSGRDRMSWPFFFDPGFDVRIRPLDLAEQFQTVDDRHERWDNANVHEFTGTYGEYLLGKVSKVFPDLGGNI